MGHITVRTSQTKGLRYQASVRVGGRERTSTHRRRLDAQRWIDANQTDLARGQWIDPNAGKVTVDAYATAWLAHRHGLRPSTQQRYKSLLARHILPVLGDIPMGRLDAGQVRSWHTELHSRLPNGAAAAYRLLAAIYRTAVDDGVVQRTPCRIRGGGTERAAERPVATPAEVARAAEAMPAPLCLAVLLASYCSLRRGEILGLQRGDVDRLTGSVSIERTWTELGLGPPKSAAGRRRLAMPAHVVTAVQAHLKKHVGEGDDAWVFPGAGDEPCAPRTLDAGWQKARKAIGRTDLHLHDLRHSGLTWTAQTGATTAELMRRAGHASPLIAMRYQHATEDRDRSLAAALEDLAREAG